MQDIKKLGIKQCNVIINDPSSSMEDVTAAKKRKSEVLAWLEKKDKEEGKTPSTGGVKFTMEHFRNLDDETKQQIKENCDNFMKVDLFRIYCIQQYLDTLGLTYSPQFVGMLFNNQIQRAIV